MNTVYIIQGETGEYADYTSWLVKSFLSEENAQNFLEEIESLYNKATDGKSYWSSSRTDKVYELMQELDPKFSYDYTGTRYYIIECPLED